MSGGRDLPADAQAGVVVGSLVRRFLAAVAISVLAGSGFYAVFETLLPFRTDWERALLALVLTLGPATAYAFGYFRCLPEALGASTAGQPTSWQRWSDFARLSAAVVILITWSAYGVVAAVEHPHEKRGIFALVVAALVAPCEAWSSRTIRLGRRARDLSKMSLFTHAVK